MGVGLMNIGRNDLCFCGSGKKYKKCCIVKTQNPQIIWKDNFDKIDIKIDKKEELKTIIFDTYDFMIKHNWQGACHTLSTIQYILLNELCLNPKLCIGVVGDNRYNFDHSWIELNNQVYDITIANGLEGVKFTEPIVSGFNINTLKKTDIIHGKGGRLDFPANVIKDMCLSEYLDGFSNQPKSELTDFLSDGLWNLIVRFAKNINLELNEEYLREKYSEVKRIVV